MIQILILIMLKISIRYCADSHILVSETTLWLCCVNIDPNLKGPVYYSKPMSIVSLNLALGLFTVVRGTQSSQD